jgi:CheY-like chemotaxis protein
MPPEPEMQHRILIVDDELSIRQLLRTLFEGAGYQVMDAASGEEVIRLAHEECIDLVITDLFMPEKDGIELILHFRKSLNPPKIIAISGVLAW